MKRARQRQMIARGAAGTLVLGVIAAVGIAGATAIRGRIAMKGPALAGVVAAPMTPTTTIDSGAATVEAQLPVPDSAPGEAIAMEKPVAAAPAPLLVTSTAASGTPTPPSGVAPVVPVGRTALRDTMVAERTGDTVRVSFDQALARTRRPEKFEAIMRSTLPQVYGAPADSALRAFPVGAVARAGDLVTTLAAKGIRIPLAGGRMLAVWPETRAGRDGPLVVAYRAVVSR